MEFVGKDRVQISSNPSINQMKYEGLLQMLDIRRDMHVTLSVGIRQCSGAHISKKFRESPQNQGTRRVAKSRSHIEDPQLLIATVQNLFATATWRPGFVQP